MIKYTFKISITHTFITVLIVIGTFASLGVFSKYITIASYGKSQLIAEDKNEILFELDLKKSLEFRGKNNTQQTKLASSMTMGVENPEILVFKLRKKKSKQELFNDFLSNISNKKQNTKKLVYADSINLRGSGIGKVVSPINFNTLRAKNKIPIKNKISTNSLRKMIKRYDQKFQACYEKALLKDELLSGKAIITLTLGENVSIQFKGLGQRTSIASLKSCLSSETRFINLGNQLVGRKVRFSLFFNS